MKHPFLLFSFSKHRWNWSPDSSYLYYSFGTEHLPPCTVCLFFIKCVLMLSFLPNYKFSNNWELVLFLFSFSCACGVQCLIHGTYLVNICFLFDIMNSFTAWFPVSWELMFYLFYVLFLSCFPHFDFKTAGTFIWLTRK